MKIEYFDNYTTLSVNAADLLSTALIKKPDLLLCTASGSSPEMAYNIFAKKYTENPELSNRLRILKLDEWGGISVDNPQSCEIFLQKNLIRPLEISPERYISFNSNPENPEKECNRISSYLKNSGPIDICVLGLGLNGHIAFNEPGDFLLPDCHVATLSQKSMSHPMANEMGEVPTYGLTIGMGDILQSKKIIMIVTGTRKKEIANEFLSGKITTQLPASFLWTHPNVVCLIDKPCL